MSFLSGKKIFLLGFIVILLVAVPLTVFLTQQTQKTTSSAAPATTLSFIPPTKTANVGDTVSLDISMDPGTNQVSFVKMNILYDATKLSADNSSLVPNPTAFQTAPLEGPTCNSGSCNITLSVGADPAKVIQGTRTKIATITFKATNPGTAQVSLPRAGLQVLSIASADQASENVLASDPLAATVTIGGTAAPAPTATASATITSTATNVPVCSSLVIDRSSTGVAPYSLTFTATGTDSNGTISTATFTFGDGQQSNFTQGGGIGTNSVNAQMAHTYNNAGTFTASAVLTDNGGAVSTACSTTITVTGAGTGGAGTTGTGGTTETITATPTATLTLPPTTPTPTPTLAATGPGEKILGIGAAGIIFSIIGGLLFLGL